MAVAHFNKKLEPHCEYCVYSIISEYSNEVLCIKKGVTDLTDRCRKYKYDPLKREPKKPKISDNYNPEDFLL